jgi:hypothetical protein
MKPRFYIWKNDNADGPFTVAQLRTMWDAGLIHGETLTCEEGQEEWMKAEFLDTLLFPEVPVSRSVPRATTIKKAVASKTPTWQKALVVTLLLIWGVVHWVTKDTTNGKRSVTANESRIPAPTGTPERGREILTTLKAARATPTYPNGWGGIARVGDKQGTPNYCLVLSPDEWDALSEFDRASLVRTIEAEAGRLPWRVFRANQLQAQSFGW